MLDWMKLYHRLPYPFRVLAASARGYYLRRWRYGAEVEQLVGAALERDTWSPEQWKSWQEERLAYMLHRAATQVPYYRRHWSERRRHGDTVSWEVLENWPVLRKDALRTQPHAFVVEGTDVRRMYHLQTSGTTGKPLQLWRSRETDRRWYALYEARVRRWNGISLKDRWAILGGQLVAPFEQTRPPFWVWNAGLHQLYMSSYHLAPVRIPAYMNAMRAHQVSYVMGYASALYALAQVVLEQDLEAPVLRVATSNAEPFYAHQRVAVAKAFRCTTRETYGMCELVAGASECQVGTMHLWPETGIIEVLQDASPVPVQPGETGRFVCTGLFNAEMPLIRYEVGDRGSLAPQEQRCPCGRPLPILRHIEGRLDDVILTPDGRRIGRLDPVFKADLPIREAQIVQKSLSSIEVRFVPAEAYQAQHGHLIEQRLRERLGRMDIVLSAVEYIPRTANGKMRSVISEVSTGSSIEENM